MGKDELRKKIFRILDKRGCWQDESKQYEYYQTRVIEETINELIDVCEWYKDETNSKN